MSDGNAGVDSQMVQVTVTNGQEGISQLPQAQPGPTPRPAAPSPRPTPELPPDTNPSPTGTPQVEFSGPFGGQSPSGRDLSRSSHHQLVLD